MNDWVKEAYDCKKYAFAADYIRLYAVYKYGGIYLDSDVEIIKRYDDFLHLPYFIGFESNDQSYLECATFGAQSNSPWIKICLDYYNNRHFILPNGDYDTKTAPQIMRDIIKHHYNVIKIKKIPDKYANTNKQFYVFQNEYFCPKSYYTRRIKTTENTYSIHQFTTTWRTPGQKFQIYTKFAFILLKQWGKLLFNFIFIKNTK